MAIPQILQQLGANNPNIAGIQNLARTIKGLKNPQAYLEQMMSEKNPQMAQAMEYVRQNGGNPKTAFEKLAAERGINPADIEQMFK